jgi:hypothetical protein
MAPCQLLHQQRQIYIARQVHGAELQLTCASAGAGNRTVGLQDAEDLVTSDNCSMLARALRELEICYTYS